MKFTKSIVAVSFYWAMLLSSSAFMFPSQVFASDVTAEEIKRIAEDGKEPYLRAIEFEYLKMFGNADISETPVTEDRLINIEDLWNPKSDIYKKNLKRDPFYVLGHPFKVYTIQTEDFLNYYDSTDLTSITRATNKWFVPVYIHKKLRAMLTVGYMNDEWQVVGIQMGDFAEFERMDNKSIFVETTQSPANFIIIHSNNENKIYPLKYFEEYMELDKAQADSSGLYDIPYFMSILTDKVNSNEKILNRLK